MRRSPFARPTAGALFAVLAGAGGSAIADHAPPWVDPGAMELGSARSVRVLKSDQPLLSGPWGGAARRGAAARDIHLPIFAAKRGPGCGGAWIQVGPIAWVCEDAVELSPAPPVDAAARTVQDSQTGLPYHYFFVGPGGSSTYKQIEDADVGDPEMTLQPGFAVAIAAERTVDRSRYGRTTHARWVPMRDLAPIRPFGFQGETIATVTDSILPVAWVVADHARVLSRPSSFATTSATKARFDVVPVLAETSAPAAGFLRIGDKSWISERDVRHPRLAEPPAEVDSATGERWIDVDLETQTLVAYEGKRPVFATLVSTGKGKPGTPMGTPKGSFRIWIKILSSDMDNLEDENASHNYRMEDVPYVQYFSKGVGLHGAFWHRSFGQVRSHGCVNLAPLDAQHLFWWTGPHLPAGWTATVPTGHEQGTVVRVR